jgi:imidazolonepropionase-like amidohydrolase
MHCLWLAVVLLIQPWARLLAAPPQTAAVTAFVDVAVVPMDRERVLAHQTVLVQGGRIVALGSVAQVAVPAEAQRIDGRGQYLIPGLADMHVHLIRACETIT